MELFIDDQFEYREALLFHLRKHNKSFCGEKFNETRYFIYKVNDQVEARCKVTFSWDWVTIKALDYNNINHLNVLVNDIVRYYKDRMCGLQYYGDDKSIIQTFVQIGFKQNGMIPKTEYVKAFYYVELTNFFNVGHNQEQSYHCTELSNDDKDYFTGSPSNPVEKIMVVALDEERFAGGVEGVIEYDQMYVHLLAVNKQYRTQGLGTKLMSKIERYARHKGVMAVNLGTTEFQAKGFYEKLGYRVCRVRENGPKGYKNYTLVKELND